MLVFPQQGSVAWILPTLERRVLYRDSHPLAVNRRNEGDWDDKEEDEDDDDEPNDVDIANFRPPKTSYGLNRGRSSPNARKALGQKASDSTTTYLCSNCGSEFVKYFGKCPTCREWNVLQAHVVSRQTSKIPPRPVFGNAASAGGGWVGGGGSYDAPIRITDVDLDRPEAARLQVPDDDEFNMVLGGGITKGSLTLLGGDPGVGKSTLMLQIASSLAKQKQLPLSMGPVWYVSGEETPHQIAQRAHRLQSRVQHLYLLQESHVDTLCEQVVEFQNQRNDDEPNHIGLLIIDSIQTMHCDAAGGGITGGVAQVRESVALLLRLAKLSGIPIVMIGHVTKSGDVAGPRTVEHMVDTVLYLEGDAGSNIRILRTSKNRFGSTDEVGVYEMTAGRLAPVLDASALFLSTRNDMDDEEGCAIAMYVERTVCYCHIILTN